MAETANALLDELKELAKENELPPSVSNRLILAGIIRNTTAICELAESEKANEKKIAVLEKVTAILSTLSLALLGWTIFG